MSLVLNNRWLLSAKSNKLIDLECHVESHVLRPEMMSIAKLLAENAFVIFSRKQLMQAGLGDVDCNLECNEIALSELMEGMCELFARLPPGRPYLKYFPRLGYGLLADVRQAHDAECDID